MTFVITSPCIDTKDKACVDVCPVDCIHFEDGIDTMLFINPIECIDCGACEPACPVTAIFEEGDIPDDQNSFIEINALWYDDPNAARAKVSGGAPEPVTETTTTDAQPEESAEATEQTPTEATPVTASSEPKQVVDVIDSPVPVAISSPQVSVQPHAGKQDYNKAIAGLEFPISRDGLLRGTKDKGGIDREVAMILDMLQDNKFNSEDELFQKIRHIYLSIGALAEDIPI